MNQTDYDCRLGAEKLLPCYCRFLLEVIKGRGELTECSKLTCFAKRMLDMVPGTGGECDRRSVSADVRHRRRTYQVEGELGKGKIDPIRRIQTPNKKKSHPHRTNRNSRTSQRAELRTMSTFDRQTVVCMYACRTEDDVR